MTDDYDDDNDDDDDDNDGDNVKDALEVSSSHHNAKHPSLKNGSRHLKN